MRSLPYIAGFVTSYVGWSVGRPLGVFVATILALVLGALGFYYARKYQRELLG